MRQVNAFLVAAAVVLLAAPAGLSTVQVSQPFQLTVDTNDVWIRAGDSPVLRYRYGGGLFKPYVKELYTPGGLNVLLDAPFDHLHHHGLMFAVGVEGVNFWEETATAGRQEHEGFSGVVAAKRAGFAAGTAWMDAGRTTLLTETRTIDVCRIDKLGATAVLWRSDLAVPEDKESATLSGAHYFGLGLRFVRDMDGGEFFNADAEEGTVFRGEERLVLSDWCAYTATIDGKPVTVAMLGHPGNARHPTTWFTMARPFAYLSATLNLHEEPLTVQATEPLILRYAVIVWDGKVDKERIDQAYQWFVNDSRQASMPAKGATR